MCGVVVLGYVVACKLLGENILDAAAPLLRVEARHMVEIECWRLPWLAQLRCVFERSCRVCASCAVAVCGNCILTDRELGKQQGCVVQGLCCIVHAGVCCAPAIWR
jgi:hypothetical protein